MQGSYVVSWKLVYEAHPQLCRYTILCYELEGGWKSCRPFHHNAPVFFALKNTGALQLKHWRVFHPPSGLYQGTVYPTGCRWLDQWIGWLLFSTSGYDSWPLDHNTVLVKVRYTAITNSNGFWKCEVLLVSESVRSCFQFVPTVSTMVVQ